MDTKRAQKKVIFYMGLTLLMIIPAVACLEKIPPPAGVVLFLLICFGSLFLLVRWHTKAFGYRCPACDQEFEISTIVNFVSPHFIDVKYLRCPNCRRFGWAKAVVKKRLRENEQRL